MKKKFGLILSLVIVIVACTAGYYWFISNSHDKYYQSYQMQLNSTNKSMELCESALGTIMLSMMEQNNNLTTNITTYLDGANNSATAATNYSADMLKYSNTDSEKAYAETLIKQSKEIERFIQLSYNLSASTKNTEKFKDILNQMNTIKTQEQSYQDDLNKIRNQYPDFKNHLQEIEKSMH
ncbi:MAG: hypothetical protein F8N39_04945 [Clostridiaceae bacterium]|nr:hypothetical protein [Clostridiaceae bacterium]